MIQDPICAECGHRKSNHIENWGGICVGCPCPGFKPLKISYEELEHRYDTLLAVLMTLVMADGCEADEAMVRIAGYCTAAEQVLQKPAP
jgi:hypothetical protein